MFIVIDYCFLLAIRLARRNNDAAHRTELHE